MMTEEEMVFTQYVEKIFTKVVLFAKNRIFTIFFISNSSMNYLKNTLPEKFGGGVQSTVTSVLSKVLTCVAAFFLPMLSKGFYRLLADN